MGVSIIQPRFFVTVGPPSICMLLYDSYIHRSQPVDKVVLHNNLL
jgi:hypothetical protein